MSGAARAGAAGARAPLVCLLSAAHPADDTRVVRKEGAALAAAGYRVLHLCRGEDAPARELLGVALQTVPARSRRAALPALLRAVLAARPAVVHASEPDSWAVALLAARRLGARAVLDVHEHYPSRLDARLPPALRPAARAALRAALAAMGRRADAVVLAKDGLEGDFPGARRAVAARNHAVVPEGLAPRAHGAGPPTLLHLGAITRARGWPQMLAALALLPEARLLVLGRFTDGSEAAFRAEAGRLGLSPRVEVAGWLPADRALARAAAEADVNLILFQPGEENHRLALPHKLFDGMAAGLATVAPRFAEAVARIVEGTGCGALCDPADPLSIAEAVRACADPARRAAMGAAGRRAAEGEWGWPAEAARLVALYRELAPLPGPGL